VGSIHLIRHGQASWGAADYDNLSHVGRDQSVSLGTAWEAADWAATSAISGGMRRHTQTAVATLDARGTPGGYDVDDRWDEFDHLALARHIDPDAHHDDPRTFQTVLNNAIARWREGSDAGTESYAKFEDRVINAFHDVVDRAGSGQRIAVFTSGGPIAMVVSHLLTRTDELFTTLNDVVVNASVTTIISGRSGVRLLSFNEHTHLPGSLVTWR